MKQSNKLRWAFIIFSLTTACEDVFVPDISSNLIIILSPPDSSSSSIVSQNFWWQETPNVDYYNVQIVSPSFAYPLRLITDTNIYSTKFTYTLLPGTYQWRVKGINFGYETQYTINLLVIDSTPDISHQTIRLIVPPDRDTMNQLNVFFDWEGLYNADNYNFQLFYQDVQVLSQIIVEDSVSHTLTEGDGAYTWKVRGQNSTSNTQFSSRSIYLDTEAPGIPLLISPIINATLPDTIISFRWNRPQHTGSSVRDSLIISRDSLFFHPIVSVVLLAPSYQDSLGQGTFFWKVRSFDKAGNCSDYSEIRRLIIRPMLKNYSSPEKP